ncbi:hypothetical protein NL676_024700 [Syzygium grande]|nr:hypothetical protein NL676_024700 [Syzygium grande]
MYARNGLKLDAKVLNADKSFGIHSGAPTRAKPNSTAQAKVPPPPPSMGGPSRPSLSIDRAYGPGGPVNCPDNSKSHFTGTRSGAPPEQNPIRSQSIPVPRTEGTGGHQKVATATNRERRGQAQPLRCGVRGNSFRPLSSRPPIYSSSSCLLPSPSLESHTVKHTLLFSYMSQRPTVPHSSSVAFGLHSHLLVSAELNPNSYWS